MFSHAGIISSRYRVMTTLLREKEFDDANKLILNSSLKKNKQSGIETQVLLCIIKFFENNNSALSDIIKLFKVAHVEVKPNIQQDIFELILRNLFVWQEYQKLIDVAKELIEYFQAIKKDQRDYFDIEFLARLFTIQGQAYKKLNQHDLATAAIVQSLTFEKVKGEYLSTKPKQIQARQLAIPFSQEILRVEVAHSLMPILDENTDAFLRSITLFDSKSHHDTVDVCLNAIKKSTSFLRNSNLAAMEYNLLHNHVVCLTNQIAAIYNFRGEFEQAVKYYTMSITYCVAHRLDLIWVILLQRGFIYFDRGKVTEYDHACADYLAALDNPAYMKESAGLSFVSLINQSYFPAITSGLAKLIEKCQQANLHLDVIKYAKIYLRFIEKKPGFSNIKYHYYLYTAYLNLERYQDALTAITNAIDVAKNEGAFYLDRAELYVKLGQANKANADLVIAKKLLRATSRWKKIKTEVDGLFADENERFKVVKLDVTSRETCSLTIMSSTAVQSDAVSADVNSVGEGTIAATAKPSATIHFMTAKKPTSIQQDKSHFNEFITKRRAEKRQINAAKKQRAQKNAEHELAVTQSKLIIQMLLANAANIAAEKARAKAEHEAKFEVKPEVNQRLIFKAVVEDATVIARHMLATKQVMTPLQFSRLALLNDKVSSLGGFLRVTGSLVLKYILAKQNRFIPSIEISDIDFQLRQMEKSQHLPARQLLLDDHFIIRRSAEAYLHLRADIDKKPVDATLVLDEKSYQKLYDPIDITRCGLVIKRHSLSIRYFDFDEHKPTLETALSKGYFTVDLSRNLDQATCIFARMIKYQRKLQGLLAMRVVLPAATIMMDQDWRHPLWCGWLKHYFDTQFKKGGLSAESCFKEINQLQAQGYLQYKQVDNILLSLCQSLLKPYSHDTYFAARNMVALLRLSFQSHAQSCMTVIPNLLSMIRFDRGCKSKILSIDELARRLQSVSSVRYTHRDQLFISDESRRYFGPIFHYGSDSASKARRHRRH
jgi:tetratricopeptide (TPR) repeat protein